MSNFPSDFHRRFTQGQRRFDIMSRVVWVFFAVVLVTIVAWWVFVGFVAVKSIDTIEEVGVKGAIEKIWCGKNEQCKAPIGN